MKRASATNLRARDNTENLLESTQNSNQEFLEDSSSPYVSNTNGLLSDSDCLSDTSKKIRKKRNTYQKISDDIRVLLLEAVQNGETLKAAAKRHKINYSSAKSILHTYRKEGRILKKSAQERTTKKKEMFSEEETPQKPVKASKKENVQPASTKASQFALLSAEKGKQQLQSQVITESTPLACLQGLNDNSSTLKSVKHEYHAEDHTHGKMATEGQTSAHHFHHKEDEHRDGTHEGAHNAQKTKYFDNFHMSYYDAPASETGVDHQHYQQHHYQSGEGAEYTNYMFVPREFDPFAEMMNTMHQNTSALLYPKGFNVVNPLDDKMGKGEHAMNYEDGGDNCPLRGFMDCQNMFRQALRKASFFSMGGNSTGYRKDSMDLF